MRKIILSIIGVLFLVGGIYFAKKIVDANQRKRPEPRKEIKTVFVDTVKNGVIPIVVEANGTLVAKRRLELYSEVQGVLKTSSRLFKAGQEYSNGQAIISIDAAEFYATVLSQRSSLFNQLTAIMPDIRLDYPEVYDKWNAYLSTFDINKSLPALPEMTSEKEKYFISGRNIQTAYYNIKNLEQRLAKYQIRAPFKGVLTEALVTEGTLIRAGQKLGEFIATDAYELPVAVNKAYADLLAVGETVALTNRDTDKVYTGKVSRINGNIDVNSQTISAFIEVSDPDLREGLYLEASLNAREESSAISLRRNLLQPDDQIFVVRDTILDLIPVNPVYFTEKSVVLTGVPDGTLVVNKVVPGAYAGMLVKIFGAQSSQEGAALETPKGE